MKRKISFTINDDFVSLEFLEKFDIQSDREIIKLIEPILNTELDFTREVIFTFIENLRDEILSELNFEFQSLGFESAPFSDGFGREYGSYVFENLPFQETRRRCIQLIRNAANNKLDYRALKKTLNID